MELLNLMLSVTYNSSVNTVNTMGWRRLVSLVICGWVLASFTGCVTIADQGSFVDESGDTVTTLGLIKVNTSGTYSRGFQTQLRFFHLLNLKTQERLRVDVQSADTVFTLSLSPGDYEVIRVQFNEGPMMMETYANLRFQVHPNDMIYLGTWLFDVDTPRTQRMIRTVISEEEPNWEEIPTRRRSFERNPTMVVSLPEPRIDEERLFTVAPNPKIGFYYR